MLHIWARTVGPEPVRTTVTRSKPTAILGIKLAFARQEKLTLRVNARIAEELID